MRSRFMAWVMMGLYSHALMQGVWCDQEVLSQGTLRVETLPHHGIQIVFEGKSLLDEKIAFKGKSLVDIPVSCEDVQTLKVQVRPGGTLGEGVIEAEGLGSFFLTPQGALGFRGNGRGISETLSRDLKGLLRIESALPLVLYDVYLEELELLCDTVTFAGSSKIGRLKGRKGRDGPLSPLVPELASPGLYEVSHGSTLELQRLQLENLMLLNRGTLRSATSLEMEASTFYNQGTVTASTSLKMTATKAVLNQGCLTAPHMEGKATQWQEQGTLHADRLSLRAQETLVLDNAASLETRTTHLKGKEISLSTSLKGQKALIEGERIGIFDKLSPSQNLTLKVSNRLDTHSALKTQHVSLQGAGQIYNHHKVQADRISLKGQGSFHNQGHIKAKQQLYSDLAQFYNQGTVQSKALSLHHHLFNGGNLRAETGHLKGQIFNKGTLDGAFAYEIDNTFENEGSATFKSLKGQGSVLNKGTLRAHTESDTVTVDLPALINTGPRAFISAPSHTLTFSRKVTTFHNEKEGTLEARGVKIEVPTAPDASWTNEGHLAAPRFQSAHPRLCNKGTLESTHLHYTGTSFLNEGTLFFSKDPAEKPALTLNGLSFLNKGKVLAEKASLSFEGAEGRVINEGFFHGDSLHMNGTLFQQRGQWQTATSRFNHLTHFLNEGTTALGRTALIADTLENTKELSLGLEEGLLKVATLLNKGRLQVKGQAGAGGKAPQVEVTSLVNEGSLGLEKVQMDLKEAYNQRPEAHLTLEGVHTTRHKDNPATLSLDQLTNHGTLAIKNLNGKIESFTNHGTASFHTGNTTVQHTVNERDIFIDKDATYYYAKSFKNAGTVGSTSGHSFSMVVASWLENTGTFVADKEISVTNKSTKDLFSILTPQAFQVGKELIVHSPQLTVSAHQKLFFPYAVRFYLDTYTNHGHMESNGPLLIHVKNACKLGLNNDTMGSLVAKGPLNLVSSSLDAQCGKIYSAEDVFLLAKQGDIKIGQAKAVRATHKQWHFGASWLCSSTYNKSCSNGSYVSSKKGVTLKAPQGNIEVSYGELFADKDLVLQVQPQRGTVTLLSGKIYTGGSLRIEGRKADFKMPAVAPFPAYSSNATYSGITYYLQNADPAYVQALEDIELNVFEVYILASQLLAGKRILYTGRPLFNEKGAATFPSTFKIKPLQRYYKEHENAFLPFFKGKLYTHFDRVSWLPASLKAGEALYASAGTFSVTGNIHAPQIVLNIQNLVASNSTLSRAAFRLPETNLIIDLGEVARTLYTPQGFAKQLGDESTGVGPEFVCPSSLPFLQTGPREALPLRMMMDASLMKFVVQQAFAQYAGTLSWKGKSGYQLLEYLEEKGEELSQKKKDHLLSLVEAQKALDSFIFYEARRMGAALTAVPHLVIPHKAINPYQAEGDISGQRVRIHTTGSQSFTGTRVVGVEDLTVTSEQTITRQTPKYVREETHGNTHICQEVAGPREEMRCLTGNATILSRGHYHEVGASTSAAHDLTRGSTHGHATVEALTLRRTETTTHKERGLFSNHTSTTTATTHTHLPNQAQAGNVDTLQSGGNTTIRGGIEQAGTAVHVKAKNKVRIEPAVAINTHERTESTSSFLGSSTQSQSMASPSVQPSVLAGPTTILEGEKAEIIGSVVQAHTLVNATTEGLRVAPYIAEVKQEASHSQSHAFGHQAQGSSQVQEVAIPTVLEVEEIVSTTSPLTAVDTPLPKKVTGTVKTEHRPLRNWSSSWASSSGLPLDQTMAFIAIATTLATGGWGASLASTWGITSEMGVAMLEATVSATASSVAANTYVNNGDVFAALRHTASTQGLKAIALEAITAGLTAKAGLPNRPQGFAACLKTNAFKAAINTGLKIAVEGADPREALRTGLITVAANTFASTAASHIGAAYGGGELDPLTHKLLHGVVAGSVAWVKGDKIAPAVMGAMIAEVLADGLKASLSDDLEALREQHPQASDEELLGLYEENMGGKLDLIKLQTAAIALASGQDVSTALTAAATALEHNSWFVLRNLAARLLFKEGSKQAGKAAMKEGTKKAAKEEAKKTAKEVGKEEAKQGAKNAASQVKSSPKADTVKGQAVPEPKSVAQAQKYKRNLREKMGKPHAEDPKLKEILERLHKTEENCVGSGSTAAAVRHEIRTGQPVKGKIHTQKAEEGITNLTRWLNKNPTARAGDRAAAENMLADLKDALSTMKGLQ